MRKLLIAPAALAVFLALTPIASAALLGLLRSTGGVEVPPPSGGAPPSPEGTGGIAPAPSPSNTGGIGVFPVTGGIGPGDVAEPKKCPKGKRRVKRGGKFVCVKKKQGNKAKANTNRRQGR